MCITRLELIYKGSELYRQGLIIGSIGTYDGTNMFERMYPHNDIYTARGNDRTTKRGNDRTTARQNERTTKRGNDCTNKRGNDQTRERMNDNMRERPHEGTTERPHEGQTIPKRFPQHINNGQVL